MATPEYQRFVPLEFLEKKESGEGELRFIGGKEAYEQSLENTEGSLHSLKSRPEG